MTKQEERRERMREEILAAAAKAIARHGFHGMSMRELARSTDRSLASFYNYFASKEEVLFALQSRAFENLIATSREVLEKTNDPAGRLYLFIATHVGYFMAHSDAMRVLVHEAAALPAPKRRRVRRLKEKYFQIARAIVADILAEDGAAEEMQDDGAIERATYNIFGMVNWVYGWYQPKRHGSPREVIQTIHHMAMQGLTGGAVLQTLHEAMDAELSAKLPSPIALRKGAA